MLQGVEESDHCNAAPVVFDDYLGFLDTCPEGLLVYEDAASLPDPGDMATGVPDIANGTNGSSVAYYCVNCRGDPVAVYF